MTRSHTGRATPGGTSPHHDDIVLAATRYERDTPVLEKVVVTSSGHPYNPLGDVNSATHLHLHCPRGRRGGMPQVAGTTSRTPHDWETQGMSQPEVSCHHRGDLACPTTAVGRSRGAHTTVRDSDRAIREALLI